MSWGCLEIVWKVSGRCLVAVWRVHKGVLQVSEVYITGCLEGINGMSEWCLGCLNVSEGHVRTGRGPKILWDPTFIWLKNILDLMYNKNIIEPFYPNFLCLIFGPNLFLDLIFLDPQFGLEHFWTKTLFGVTFFYFIYIWTQNLLDFYFWAWNISGQIAKLTESMSL